MSDTTELTTRPADSQTAVTNREPAERDTPRTRIAPAVDIVEDAHGITLYADLPGVPRDKLDVRVHDGNLSIEAQAVIPTPTGLRLQHGEVRHPHFSRAFTLSADCDVSRIDAQLRDGVLQLKIPRREEARPRRIEVTAG